MLVARWQQEDIKGSRLTCDLKDTLFPLENSSCFSSDVVNDVLKDYIFFTWILKYVYYQVHILRFFFFKSKETLFLRLLVSIVFCFFFSFFFP